jgi:hypothetical protein
MSGTLAAAANSMSKPAGPRLNSVQAVRTVAAGAAEANRKVVGFGLPCANCRTYYPADLKNCPVCKSAERVAVTAVKLPATVAPSEQLPDPALLEQERERFLREFKEQLAMLEMSGHSTAYPRCTKDHAGEFASAAICQTCYDHLQERVDVLEAALHMNLKEAAQIIYDAVWADVSDPSKTYENAASALLSELRKRSGVPQTFALLQAPMVD